VLSNRQYYAPLWAIAEAEHNRIQTRYKFNPVSKL